MRNFLSILKLLKKNNQWNSFMLTGGNSASLFYKKLSSCKNIMSYLQKFVFYMTDERCVSVFNKNSNYRLVCNSLFSGNLLSKNNLNKMYSGNKSLDAIRYEKLLPSSIDLLLLSIGDDGHIASLFPNSHILKEKNRLVRTVFSTNSFYHRLTITPKVIENAKEVIVLALGPKKLKIFEEAKKNPQDINSLPARLVLKRNWIFEL
jgi:6-phosphogluconolactonase